MTADRYFGMIVNFALLAVISRLLSPAEIGVSAIGVAITTISMSVREFASIGYLIQKTDITLADKRTSATLSLSLGTLIAATCWVLAPFVERAYATDGVAFYLRLCAVALVIESFNVPLVGLMRRDLQFGKVAIVNVTNLVVGAALIALLAANGFGFTSYGWAWIASASAAAVVAFALRPELACYRPSLSEWRGPIAFGGYNGMAALLNRAYDSIPLLLFGKTIGLQQTGYFFRSINICQLPDKMFLAGVLQVALPALSRVHATGGDMKAVYLRSAAQISGLYWPALAMLALLASPVVQLLLGPQWSGVTPLVRIMAVAWMFAFSNDLITSVLISQGNIRSHLIRSAFMWPISGAILVTGSTFGALGATIGIAISIPIQWLISFLVLRRHLKISFLELFRALQSSLIVVLATVSGPLLVVFFLLNGRFDFGLPAAIGLGAVSGLCWISALFACRHPLREEIVRISSAAMARIASRARPGASRV